MTLPRQLVLVAIVDNLDELVAMEVLWTAWRFPHKREKVNGASGL